MVNAIKVLSIFNSHKISYILYNTDDGFVSALIEANNIVNNTVESSPLFIVHHIMSIPDAGDLETVKPIGDFNLELVGSLVLLLAFISFRLSLPLTL